MLSTWSGNIESELFSGTVIENIAVIRLKQGLLLHVGNLKAKDRLFDYVDAAAQHPDIHVILIVGTPEKAGIAEYIEFYRRIVHSSNGLNQLERLYNAVNQFVLKLRSIDTFVIHADQGRVISLFFNMSLACDYRMVGDNTRYEHPYLKLGLVPKGGGAFFLSKMLGASKAYQILLADQPITATEAQAFGLVDQIVPADNLDSEAMATARRFAAQPQTTLSGLKRLVSYDLPELRDQLEMENDTLRLIIRSKAFNDRLSNLTAPPG